MSKEKQIDIIRDLLKEFDEMGFVPSTAVPNHEAYAIQWRAEITKALVDYFKQTEWISVDERLPEKSKTILCTDGIYIGTVYYSGEFGFEDYAPFDKITHWMPLPEPPRKEDEGK